ncbi:MAG: hypothetical protein OXD47_06995 [Gammaproteobacteria bacterium]|nr:hypothetical protein [Gammaproteobacteria bacterium]MCY4283625.1 hypothetical protein [Gammaproteobacteria bacterium]MCY4338533.1 hypothetical protein [Gammaproteobacteria bacterium]
MKRNVLAIAFSAILFLPAHAKTPYESMAGVNLIMRNSMIVVALMKSDVHCEKVTHSLIQGIDSYGNVIMSIRCSRQDGDYVFIEKADGTATVLACDKASVLFSDLGIDGRCWMPLERLDSAIQVVSQSRQVF